ETEKGEAETETAETPAGNGGTGFTPADATARHVGTLVHRMLRAIAVQGPTAWHGRVAERRADFAAELAALGVPMPHQEGAAERVVAVLERTLADATGRWLLDPEHA
ncbi:MAG: hypothetical protein ABEK42_09560, partial [Thiohalorhabdaceae bacterium]